MLGDGKIRTVHASKVARCVKAAGFFMLLQIEDYNLIITEHFVLRVDEDQFWAIQCKLEAKKINVWLIKNKGGLEVAKGATAGETLDKYYQMVTSKTMEEIKRTSLILGNSVELFTDEDEYIGVSVNHLDMIEYSPVVKKAPGENHVIVDDIHVFTVVRQESLVSKYLRTLYGKVEDEK